jgi:hypothetical protein
VKNTNGPKTMERRKLPDFARVFFSAWPSQAPVLAPLELARHIVFGAVDYARDLGFEPHPTSPGVPRFSGAGRRAAAM